MTPGVRNELISEQENLRGSLPEGFTAEALQFLAERFSGVQEDEAADRNLMEGVYRLFGAMPLGSDNVSAAARLLYLCGCFNREDPREVRDVLGESFNALMQTRGYHEDVYKDFEIAVDADYYRGLFIQAYYAAHQPQTIAIFKRLAESFDSEIIVAGIEVNGKLNRDKKDKLEKILKIISRAKQHEEFSLMPDQHFAELVRYLLVIDFEQNYMSKSYFDI